MTQWLSSLLERLVTLKKWSAIFIYHLSGLGKCNFVTWKAIRYSLNYSLQSFAHNLQCTGYSIWSGWQLSIKTLQCTAVTFDLKVIYCIGWQFNKIKGIVNWWQFFWLILIGTSTPKSNQISMITLYQIKSFLARAVLSHMSDTVTWSKILSLKKKYDHICFTRIFVDLWATWPSTHRPAGGQGPSARI